MNARPHFAWMLALVFGTGFCLATPYTPAETPPLSFNRDIRPILSDNCFRCHGPDAAHREADLRLDQAESATALRDGKQAVAPRNPAASELVRRITSADPDLQMPPPDSGQKLTPAQTELLKTWIAQGAEWQSHWSLIPPQRAVPPISPQHAQSSPIDAFLAARLAREGLKPNGPAAPATLLRRATLDLTGLPPTPAEQLAFAADRAPDAYERLIDRLLVSPRYAERMAGPWLDAARYADTNGYQSDGERHMWRWRDWVLEAYSRNLPFNQFTIEQLAGDLLPQPTLAQRIATGFNRNHRGNAEGGIIPEEYAVEYVADRVETTATVWLGLTVGCSRCHDHKFDPLTMRDYYGLFAFFNNVPEKGRAVKFGNSPPYIPAPTAVQEETWRSLQNRVRRCEAEWSGLQPKIGQLFSDWENSPPKNLPDWRPSDGVVLEWTFDEPASAKPDPSAPTQTEGKRGRGGRFAGEQAIDAGDQADFGYFDAFTLSAWVRLEPNGGGTIVSRMTDVPEGDGFQLAVVGGKLQLNLVKRWLDDALRIETAAPLPTGRWVHITATYDGSREATGVRFFVDGQRVKPHVLLDELNQSFNTKQPLRIGAGGGPSARFRGLLDEVRISRGVISTDDLPFLAIAESVEKLLALPPPQRSALQAEKLWQTFIRRHAPAAVQESWSALVAAKQAEKQFAASLPTVMVMEELPEPRPTHILLRGQYDQPGERVSAATPAALGNLPKESPQNRLGLANWLVNEKNPLTARVQVNRTWQLHFGVGLVKTSEDFGSQGEWPLHAELLDWLATEFVRTGWDQKRLTRTLVTSAAYRRDAKVSPAALERDPENRLHARFPRLRLSAEQLRDQALAASGLLVEQVGGPSVLPYQPPGLWNELTGGADYEPGRGAQLYRRSLYTYWKRTIAPPSMTAFDASTREFCTVRQSRTNTPLQALALLNETLAVETAKNLAARVLTEAATADERLERLFQLVLAREPVAPERARLLESLARHHKRFSAAPQEAEELLSVGESKPSANSSPAELAAWTILAQVVLNLDEAVNRP